MEISDEDDLDVKGDRLVYFGDRNVWKIGRLLTTSTFIEQGIITCPEHPGADVSTVISRLLPRNIYHGSQKSMAAPLFTDQDAMGHFDPSRIPPRVAFQVPHARLGIEKEISDLLKSESGQPPALTQVSLSGPKYKHLARCPIALVVKRKSVDLYKGWM